VYIRTWPSRPVAQSLFCCFRIGFELDTQRRTSKKEQSDNATYWLPDTALVGFSSEVFLGQPKEG
jgi:hypothetical protein